MVQSKPLREPPRPDPSEDILSDDEWGVGSDLDQDWADDWGEDRLDPTATAADKPLHGVTDLGDENRRGQTLRSASESPAPKKRRRSSGSHKSSVPSGEARDHFAWALRRVHQRLLRSPDLRRTDADPMRDRELRERTRQSVKEIVASMSARDDLPGGVDPKKLIARVLDEALGLGPIEDFFRDDSVTEIMVNNAQQVFVERRGKLEQTDRSFSSDQAVLGVIERIVSPIGRRIDESSPMVDARLKDGSRVNAIIPPLSLRGPTLTIRKFKQEPLQVDDLVASGTVTADMAEFLETCVKARRNILVSGGTGSGKTTTLNVLSGFIGAGERIITIEDAAELKLDQAHVVSLEARPPDAEGKGAIAIRDLVRNALRMRPDRIVVGQCRGGEALDILQAMTTGHEGSLTTVHANSPRDALARLETMVLMAGMDLPVRAIRGQIASAVSIVVQQATMSDGSRKVTQIAEVTGMEGDAISTQDIFLYEQEGSNDEGRAAGRHRPSGVVPSFYELLSGMGIRASADLFQE
jgi:pilus assembly protein CpaF